MSRGGLLLRRAVDREELEYIPVEGAVLHGKKPPKLTPRRYPRPRSAGRGGGDVSPRREEIGKAIPEAPRAGKSDAPTVSIPEDRNEAVLDFGGRKVKLTNLRKPFWPELGVTKGDLLRYYLRISPVLLPHLLDRAMVMKRYPNGAAGKFFFQKRAPKPRPDWIEICSIEHASGNIIDFPVIRDLPSLLWVVNLGCIDLNPWYARCDDIDRPDYLHFDLDPVAPGGFGKVLADGEDRAPRPGCPRDAERRQDDRVGRDAHLRAHRSRTAPEAGLDLCQEDGQEPRAALSRGHYRGVPDREEAAGPRPGGLQPERVGPHAGVRVLRPSQAPGDGLRSGELGARWKRGSEWRIFASTICPSGWRRRGDLWETLLSPQNRFDLSSVLALERSPPEMKASRLPIQPPYPVMDAELVRQLPRGAEWQYEPKWDGFRCLAFRDGDEVELQAKSGKSLTRYFPDVVSTLKSVRAPTFVIDSELVIPVEEDLSFEELQLRLHPAESRVRKLSAAHPATMVAFDLLVDGKGRLLAEIPLKERRKGSRGLFHTRSPRDVERLRLSPATTDLKQAREWFRRAGSALDGIVAKRLDFGYRSGDRTGMVKYQDDPQRGLRGGRIPVPQRKKAGRLPPAGPLRR